jgi:hypothetical protein
MRAKMVTQVERLRAAIGEGCPACRDWPLVHCLSDTEPMPPTSCARCGRRFAGLVRRYVGVDPDAVCAG